MKKILVTGGAGFVGRHLCKALLDRGDRVVCVDSIVPLTGGICPLEKGWPLYNPLDYDRFVFIKQDCRDFFSNTQWTDFDEVFHLAAIVGGRELIEHNPLAVAEDLAIDAMFWRWAQAHRPGKIVCFSSSAAYPVRLQGADSYMLLVEDMIRFDKDIGVPDMSYGWSKLTHEYLANIAHQKYELDIVTYRPFSGYGEDQDMAYPFPSICHRVICESGSQSIKVWGSGDQMRDFIHIEDCVRGVLLTMHQIHDASAVNLSSGIFTKFRDLARKAANEVGFDPEIIGMSQKPEGVFARAGDTIKQRQMGFVPEISLQQGVARCVNYFQRAAS